MSKGSTFRRLTKGENEKTVTLEQIEKELIGFAQYRVDHKLRPERVIMDEPAAACAALLEDGAVIVINPANGNTVTYKYK